MKVRQYKENGEYVLVEIDYKQPTADELMQMRYMEIERIKSELQESDYKVIKCAEAMTIGAEFPYNMTELHKERQSLRDKINELEKEMSDAM